MEGIEGDTRLAQMYIADWWRTVRAGVAQVGDNGNTWTLQFQLVMASTVRMGQVGEYDGKTPTEMNCLTRVSGMSAWQCIAGYSMGSELQKTRSVTSKMGSMSELSL